MTMTITAASSSSWVQRLSAGETVVLNRWNGRTTQALVPRGDDVYLIWRVSGFGPSEPEAVLFLILRRQDVAILEGAGDEDGLIEVLRSQLDDREGRLALVVEGELALTARYLVPAEGDEESFSADLDRAVERLVGAHRAQQTPSVFAIDDDLAASFVQVLEQGGLRVG